MVAKTSARKSPARKATPRKAAPRKQARAATARAGGGANGEAVEAAPPPPGETNGAEVPSVDQAAPNQAVKLVPDHEVVNPYKDKTDDIYVHFPRNGDPPIVFPAARTLKLDRHFIWSIYKKSAMVQGFEWMERAEVPEHIQERVVMLEDDEYEAFWAGWFKSMGVVQSSPQGLPGES
jgi:hypothetical protein